MKHCRNLLFAILLAPLMSNAQVYQPGKVVDMKGDTLSGLIEYAEWTRNPTAIHFRLNPDEPVRKLSPADIKFFSVSVGHLAEFVAYAGPVSTGYTDVDHVQAVPDSSSRMDAVFLKIVQDGKNLKLFSYTDNQKTRFFIGTRSSDKPIELIYRAYLKDEGANSSSYIVYQTDFKRQLYDAAVNTGTISPELQNLISKSGYNEQDMLQITGKVNNIAVDDVSKTNVTKGRPSHIAFAIAAVGAILVVLVLEFSRIHSVQ